MKTSRVYAFTTIAFIMTFMSAVSALAAFELPRESASPLNVRLTLR
jgi:hypothetical protein